MGAKVSCPISLTSAANKGNILFCCAKENAENAQWACWHLNDERLVVMFRCLTINQNDQMAAIELIAI